MAENVKLPNFVFKIYIQGYYRDNLPEIILKLWFPKNKQQQTLFIQLVNSGFQRKTKNPDFQSETPPKTVKSDINKLTQVIFFLFWRWRK